MTGSDNPVRAVYRLEETQDQLASAQELSQEFFEVSFDLDPTTTGVYPQANLIDQASSLENDEGLYYDRFPKVLREPLRFSLEAGAYLTSVMSSNPFTLGFLLDAVALKVFSNVETGRAMFTPSIVIDHDSNEHPFSYMFMANHVDPQAIDYENSIFRISSVIGQPSEVVNISSSEDLFSKRRFARDGVLNGCKKFSTIDTQLIKLLPGAIPTAPLFGLGRVSSRLYCSVEFRNLFINAKASGLEFKASRRLQV